jgi:cobalt/nickel transport protein
MINVLLLVAVVAIFAVPLALRLNTSGQAEGEAYAGSDSSATAAVEELSPGYQPWFTPLFAPSSGEVESGLFALQAALGAGAFGFVLGRLSGRRSASGSSPAAVAPTAEPPAIAPPAIAAPAIAPPA